MDVNLNVLTEEEAKLLKKLLAKAKSSPVRRSEKKNTLKPYKLQVILCCRTCKTKSSIYYNMVANADNTGLVSQRTTDERMESGDIVNERDCNTCTYCSEYLSSLSKEVLVKMYLTLANRR